jgi:hypothetical protein
LHKKSKLIDENDLRGRMRDSVFGKGAGGSGGWQLLIKHGCPVLAS